MSSIKINFFQFIKRKELLIYLIIIITCIGILGWVSGKTGLASIFVAYIPIAPSTALIFILLSVLIPLKIGSEKSHLLNIIINSFIIFIAVFCILLFLNHVFNLNWDIERYLINKPEKLGEAPIGHMSPITAILILCICVSYFGLGKNVNSKIKFLAGSFSLFLGLASSVILIGYLYGAPLLYGGTFIPVSLPAALCFFLFSLILLREFEHRYWTFNMKIKNPIVITLLQSFLPIVIFITILQGLLTSNFSINQDNPGLSIALILLITIFITVFIVIVLSRSLGDDLQKAEQALSESKIKLQQLNDDKDIFISILSHDLRSPFNNLLGFSELLNQDIRNYSSDEIEEIAKNINRVARNTYNLLEDILLWVQSQQGSIIFNPQKVNINEICKEILVILNPSACVKNIIINNNTPEGFIVVADINMLKTILRNLVSNAIKFTNNEGIININAEQDSKNVTISVSDNGIGIPAENIPKLFDISQLHTTKGTAKESGTGFGLLLCKQFVEKHDGRLWVNSEYGKGSEFKFTLPMHVGNTVNK